jgi:hypothetical protein
MVNRLVKPINVARLLRAGLRACLIPACLSAFGCSGVPNVVLDTPTGPIPLITPAPVMPAGLPPPPGMENVQPYNPPSPQSVSRDGTYSGTAEPLDTGGGLCVSSHAVGAFIVRGNSVRYGGFRGRIAADGGLQMQYGQDWLVGQFEGATFHGQLSLLGRFGAPGCTYMFNLGRTGP